MKKLLTLVTVLLFTTIVAQAADVVKFPSTTVSAPKVAVSQTNKVSTAKKSVVTRNVDMGSYGQPASLGTRRFLTTEVYVERNPWEVSVAQWYVGDVRNGTHGFKEELSLGLPLGFQVDLYENLQATSVKKWTQVGLSPEIRWAVAGWDRLFLNPTLAYQQNFVGVNNVNSGYDVKLILGQTFGKYVTFGTTLQYGYDSLNPLVKTYEVSSGLAFNLTQKLSVGAEDRLQYISGKPSVAVGPSVQYKLGKRGYVDVAYLRGLDGNYKTTSQSEVLASVGFKF